MKQLFYRIVCLFKGHIWITTFKRNDSYASGYVRKCKRCKVEEAIIAALLKGY